MTATCVLGQICEGPVAEMFHTTILHMCAKFHAFITKGTIYLYICCTMNKIGHYSKRKERICIKLLTDVRFGPRDNTNVLGKIRITIVSHELVVKY